MRLHHPLKHARVLLCASALVFSTQMFAQFDAASVLGYVRDSAGASVANATVTLTNVETGVKLTAHTDSQGRYEFDSVKIGDYKVSAESTGFSIADTPQFGLSVNARQRVDVALRPAR